MNRQETNQQLVDILQFLIEINPDLRFSQILSAYGFVKAARPARPELKIEWQNEFYTEPEKILERVESRLDG